VFRVSPSPAITGSDVRKKFDRYCSIRLILIEKDAPIRQFGGFGFGIGSAVNGWPQGERKIG